MYQVITTTDDLLTYIESIQHCQWLALDTEFIRERTYYPKLCLVQIAAHNKEGELQLACIDPLEIDDISALLNLLNNSNIIKVLHAAHQDLEIFNYLSGQVPQPIFDTQPAASVLGYGDHMGYARLMQQVLKVDLDKSQSRTNWANRPLNQAQLDYAIDDVRYLAQAYPIIRDKLISLERLDWLDHDFAHFIDPKLYAINATTRWKKVRGLQVLKRQQLAILRELAAWRENLAERKNLPRKWMIKDEILIDLARQQPKDVQTIADMRGINAARTKKYHKIWLDCITKGLSLAESECPEINYRKKPSITQDKVIDVLMTALSIHAQELDITPAVITTRKKVTSMVLEQRQTLSNDWRGALVNALFNDLLKGKKGLAIQNGKAVIISSA
ncbi:MAG: ribonuclease D [Cocleimonas sp.]|nr:ribonuclease D [Cocleimonas sp.]